MRVVALPGWIVLNCNITRLTTSILAIQFYLESIPSPTSAEGAEWVSGWIFGCGGTRCCAVRARHGRQSVLAFHGLARPDVSAAHPGEPESGLSGFRVMLTELSRAPVILEWLDAEGHWHEFWREPGESSAGRPRRNTAPVLTESLLPIVLDEIAGAFSGRSWRAAWRHAGQLVTDCTHRLTLPPPGPNWRVYLDEPVGDRISGPYLRVSGWIFDRNSPVRRIFARAEPCGAVHLIYPKARPDVVAAHAGLSVPVACGFVGMIRLPAIRTPWFVFRLYAEAADGTVHLALVRRFFLKDEGPAADPGWQAAGVVGALALLGCCRLQSWTNWRRALWAGLRRRRPVPAAMEITNVDPSPPAKLSVTVKPLPADPLISILVPVFNPTSRHLCEMITSVQAQLYPRWELCLADDASTEPHVRPLLERFARTDPRIRPVYRSENGQIARATNTALAEAGGEFVALLDHDDLLAPEALLRVVEAIRTHSDAQFIYTNRDKVDDDGHHFDAEQRGAWNPAMALTHNYLHHLTVIRRSLVERAGNFRPDYFGSQDLDLYLRCHELIETDQIVHVPVIGYHWRVHPGSTASRGDQKNYMFSSARRGITDALQRRGLRAQAFLPEFASFYGLNLHQLRWDSSLLRENPVSVVLAVAAPGEDESVALAALVRTVPAGSVQLIVVSTEDSGGPLPWPEVIPAEKLTAPAGTALSELFNRGAALARNPLLLLLDACVVPTAPGWLEDLVGWLSVSDVEAVGPKMIAACGLLASAGWTIDHGSGLPKALWAGEAADDLGHQFLLHTARDSLFLDPSCVLTRTVVFREIGGYDTAAFPEAFFVADYCLRIHDRGRRVVFSPQAVLRRVEDSGCDATPAESEALVFRRHHAGRSDPWIPSALISSGSGAGPTGVGSSRNWMPGRTVEFSGGWFFLEHPRSGETLTSDRLVLQGWCLARPGRVISELRLRVGSQTRLLTYGHPRPDVAAASGYIGEFLPAGFGLELDLPPGPVRLQFEAQCEDSGWQFVSSVEATVVPVRHPAVRGRCTVASIAQLADGVEMLVEPPAVGTLPVTALKLAREWPWRDVVINPALPFLGFWNEPTGVVRPVYGGVEIRGWLFHETLAIRRVAAGFASNEWLQIAHQHDSSLISGRFVEFPSAAQCAITGFVPVPPTTRQPRTLRLWAELENGEWHLVYVRRCWVRDEGESRHLPVKPVSRRMLVAAALSFHWALWRCGISGPGLAAVWSVVRQLHRRFRPSEPSEAPALPAPVRAPVPSEPHLILVTHNLNQEGAPYFLLELALFIRRNTNARLTVVSAAEGPLRQAFESHGLAVRLVNRVPLWTARTPRDARRALAALAGELGAHEASLIVANTIESFWAVQAARLADRPSLFYIHEPGVFGLHYLGHLGAATRALAADALMQATTRVSFPSGATQAYYEPLSRSGNQRIQPGWTDLSRIRPADMTGTRTAVRARLGLTVNEQLVINVGTVCPRKGQVFFVNAAERLGRDQPVLTARCRFLLIGAHDNAYGEMLIAHLGRLGAGHPISMQPATTGIGDYFAAADLFVLSSFEEGFPRVLLEAMGFGLPIVSTAIHAVPEIARAGEEALLVPPGDSRAMAEAMRQLLEDKELARRLGHQAQRRVEEKFTAEHVLPGHLATIRELVPNLAEVSPKSPPPCLREPFHAAFGATTGRPT